MIFFQLYSVKSVYINEFKNNSDCKSRSIWKLSGTKNIPGIDMFPEKNTTSQKKIEGHIPQSSCFGRKCIRSVILS